MQKLVRGKLQELTFEEFWNKISSTSIDVNKEVVRREYERVMREEIWINDTYQVNVNKNPRHGFIGHTVWWLSIKRVDKQPIHDWRDLQEIKNQLCGPEAEGFELYPAESRVVDTANQYHLFVLMTHGFRLPVGFEDRLVTNTQADWYAQRPRS